MPPVAQELPLSPSQPQPPTPPSWPPPEFVLNLLIYVTPAVIILIALTCLLRVLIKRLMKRCLCTRASGGCHRRSSSSGVDTTGSLSPSNHQMVGPLHARFPLPSQQAQRIFIVRTPGPNFPLPAHFLPPNLWAFSGAGRGANPLLGAAEQAIPTGIGALPTSHGALGGYWREDIVEQMISSFPPKYEEAMRQHQQQSSASAGGGGRRRGRRQQRVGPVVPIQVVIPSPPPLYSQHSLSVESQNGNSPPAYAVSAAPVPAQSSGELLLCTDAIGTVLPVGIGDKAAEGGAGPLEEGPECSKPPEEEASQSIQPVVDEGSQVVNGGEDTGSELKATEDPSLPTDPPINQQVPAPSASSGSPKPPPSTRPKRRGMAARRSASLNTFKRKGSARREAGGPGSTRRWGRRGS